MGLNPQSPPARQGQSCSRPHLWAELLLFAVPLCFLHWKTFLTITAMG